MATAEPKEVIKDISEDNLYRVCHLVVQRARQIQGGTTSLLPTSLEKPTSKALEELRRGKIRAYTAEEWATEEALRAAEIPPPLDQVLAREESPAEQVEDTGGFAGFLNAVMRGEPSSEEATAEKKARKEEVESTEAGAEAASETGE